MEPRKKSKIIGGLVGGVLGMIIGGYLSVNTYFSGLYERLVYFLGGALSVLLILEILGTVGIVKEKTLKDLAPVFLVMLGILVITVGIMMILR